VLRAARVVEAGPPQVEARVAVRGQIAVGAVAQAGDAMGRDGHPLLVAAQAHVARVDVIVDERAGASPVDGLLGRDRVLGDQVRSRVVEDRGGLSRRGTDDEAERDDGESRRDAPAHVVPPSCRVHVGNKLLLFLRNVNNCPGK
jgi:hypothetical protein